MSDTFDSGKTSKIKTETPVLPTRVWSPEQLAIFKACENSDKNLVIRARAGTGKTTTILEACQFLQGRTILCAFNKRIADELKLKAPLNVHVYTLHGLGFRLVKRAWPNVRVDENRTWKLALTAATKVGLRGKDTIKALCQLISTSKDVAPFAKKAEDLDGVGRSFGAFDRIIPAQIPKMCAAAMLARAAALEDDGTIDFSDMIFVPLHKALTRGEYDNVVVDEAQDMNRAQLELASRVKAKDGRMIVVGDDRQAIYGFRGADSSSLDRLKTALKAEEFSLTETYRCPKAIVAIAQGMVPDIRSNKEGGEILFGTREWLTHNAAPGDFILSRTNAPLLRVCMDLIAAGKRAKIEGRDIGKGLIGIVEKLRPGSIPDLLTLLAEWSELALERAGDDAARQDAVLDQRHVLEELAKVCESVDALIARISNLFLDVAGDTNTIVCSTIHKAKGLEADRVHILCDSFRGVWKGGGSEESNLKYVAVTRAKKTLVWIDPPVGSGLRPQKGVSTVAPDGE